MKKALHTLIAIFAISASGYAQNEPKLQSEVIAPVTTLSGTLVISFAKPLPADDRPTNKFMCEVAEHTPKLVQVLYPENSPEQDDGIESLLQLCFEQKLSVILYGALVRHTNSFGERDSLVISGLEIVLPPESGIHQKIVFAFKKH